MARRKRGSRILEEAQKRLDGIQATDPKLNVGSGFTAAGYLKMINELRSDISAYNIALSNVDELTNRVADKEKLVAQYSERMLLGVASQYGKDSHEYEKAGGTRKRDRKRPTRKKVAVAS